ncbi:MAG: hypothetical protein J3Q66DRAFT_411969 [Benniella sp.]|nr:MAG: hypothetical protein J3Q66DRAFT_411969 [Benniella sp.]
MSLPKLQKTTCRTSQLERYTHSCCHGQYHTCRCDKPTLQEAQDPDQDNTSKKSTAESLSSLQTDEDIDLNKPVIFGTQLPLYITCFSPLSLPTDLYAYLLRFLSGGDLWRLCQVSRSLKRETLKFMPKYRKLEFEIVRILHQEHFHTDAELHRLALEKQFDERFDRHWRRYRTYSLDIPASPTPSPPTPPPQTPGLLLGGSIYQEPYPGPESVEDFSTDRGENRDRYWTLQSESLLEAIVKGTPYEVKDGSSSNIGAGLVRNSFSGPSIPRSWISKLQRNTDRPPPLPMDRFGSLVNVMFDSNLVSLNHRRAFINCARYMAAEIELSFGGLVNTITPRDTLDCTTFMDNSKVNIGPYLRVLVPFDEDQDAGTPLDQRALRPDTFVSPPRELSGYIQVMLWSRCLHGLVALYNQIHERHDRFKISSKCSPCCCIHSPGHSDCCLCCVATSRRFHPAEPNFSLRRSKMEEGNRQGTLVKHEILSLCYMACGLFTAPVVLNPGGYPRSHTIMTHLRLGSPWRKGVWREGEWRHAPIDQEHDIDEVSMDHRLNQERERELEEGLHRRSGASQSDAQDRLNELFAMTSERHGREGEDDTVGEGPWQELCLAAVRFLVNGDLQWAGSATNSELNRQRVTEDEDAWYYAI